MYFIKYYIYISSESIVFQDRCHVLTQRCADASQTLQFASLELGAPILNGGLVVVLIYFLILGGGGGGRFLANQSILSDQLINQNTLIG